MLIASALIVIWVATHLFPNDHSASSTNSTATSTPAPAIAETPTTTAPPLPLPTPDDFKINVIVTKQDCFGSAGCNEEYEIDPNYTGLAAALDHRSIRVTYQINGGDNPKTGNFSVANGMMHYEKSGFISTDSSDVNITATPTQVIPEQ